jgi:hypothetical protein
MNVLAALLLSIVMVTDEPDAVLSILDKRAAGETITEADWNRLFTSEGYVRLKAREHSMNRKFDEETFRAFVMSEELLARRSMLARTLASWKQADLTRSRRRAAAYLPRGATIKAKVYPSIKPATNSFVFELERDPAIFLYVDDQPRERFETTVAHELHHVGYASACGAGNDTTDVHVWLGAFGEGFAVLAAGGRRDPQRHSAADVRKAWSEGQQQFAQNFRAIESFLLDVASGKLPEEEQQKRAAAFYGLVGPWYSVGWKLGVVIEQTLGRHALVAAMCDRTNLLATYNRASELWAARTGERLPKWSAALVRPAR